MLKLIITVTIFMTALLSQAQVSEIRKVENFSKIEVASGIELHYKETQGTASVKVEANEGNLTDIITKVNGTTLSILTTGKNKKEQIIKVYVAAKDVTSFSAISKSKIVFENIVNAENMSIVLESGGYFKGYFRSKNNTNIETGSNTELNGRIETVSFTGDFRNKSKVNLSGNAKNAIITATTKAYCTARNFLTENTEVNSDNAIVSITSKSKINVNATDHASVTYFGSPKKTNIEQKHLTITKKYIKPSLLAME